MRALTLALALTLLAVSPASAAPITVTFPGVFTSVTDPDGLLPSVLRVGAPFTVEYTIDPDAVVPGFCFHPTGGVVCGYGVPLDGFSGGLTIHSASFPLILPNGDAFVPEVAIRDMQIDSWTLTFPLGDGARTRVEFRDPTGSRIEDAFVFFVNDAIDGWGEATLSISPESGGPLATGSIIPEPSSATLVLIGLAGLLLGRLRSQSQPDLLIAGSEHRTERVDQAADRLIGTRSAFRRGSCLSLRYVTHRHQGNFVITKPAAWACPFVITKPAAWACPPPPKC